MKTPCPDGQILKLWLRSACSSRAELVEFGQEIDEVKEKIFFNKNLTHY